MQWKHSLHALAVRDPAHGESFIQPAALTTDHNARKDLDSFLVAFYHSCMYTHAVANRKWRDLAFLLLFPNNINDLVHKLVASARGCGRTLSFEENAFATRNRGAFEQKRKHEDMQKICENLANLWLIPSPSAPVAQLDRALASGAKGCGFDPRRAQNAWLTSCGPGRARLRNPKSAISKHHFSFHEKAILREENAFSHANKRVHEGGVETSSF